MEMGARVGDEGRGRDLGQGTLAETGVGDRDMVGDRGRGSRQGQG